MERFLSHIGMRSSDNPTDEYFLELLRKIDLNGRVAVLNIARVNITKVDKDAYFTVREWIDLCVREVEDEIDKLLSYYSSFISPELMSILEQIPKSMVHRNMASHLTLQHSLMTSTIPRYLWTLRVFTTLKITKHQSLIIGDCKSQLMVIRRW